MPRRFCLTLIIALLWLPATHAAQAKQRVHVGYYEFPPYSYTDAHGQPSGSGLELTARLLEQAGYQAEFRSLPGARLYNDLRDGSVHLWPGAPGKTELSVHTLETRHTLGEIILNLYFRPGTPPPHLPEDLRGKGVILISGYSYWQTINQWLVDPALGITQHRTSNHDAALEMLQRRRADYLLNYQTPVEQAKQRLGIDELPYVQLQRVPLKLIVSRLAPNAEALRDALDHAYEELAASGEKLQLP
ncbi:ABC transporter substrate-binding protein [Ectopseudomonas oleovorans]|uniref:substrate-binding periplasmic protein n=1 Tax=Ectopseudomonas oleovorans TaxID=301 RepID=UPI0025DC1FCA|nr:transporter substrate-binding domain-containing protein [Pseudomonas oleovorans]MCW1938323.1 transporter substrate-binding domain-containing protein [Pseudomonas sp. MDMC_285]